MATVTVSVDGVTTTTLAYTVASRARKGYVRGLVDRGGRARPPYTTSIVLQHNWADLEPSRGAYDFGPIRRKMDAAKAAGATAGRIRLNAGITAPAWVKDKAGTFTVVDGQGGQQITSARFWTPEYQDAALALDTALAAEFDDDDFVLEVMAWPNGSEFSCECMIRQAGASDRRRAYLAAGYDHATDQANILAYVDHFAGTWKRTHMGTWVSMFFQRINADGTFTSDRDFTGQYLQHVKDLLPDSMTGVNNADANSYAPLSGIYQFVTSYGMRRGDQTATLAKIGSAANLAKTFELAPAAGVGSIEVPSGYDKALPSSQLTQFDAALRAV